MSRRCSYCDSEIIDMASHCPNCGAIILKTNIDIQDVKKYKNKTEELIEKNKNNRKISKGWDPDTNSEINPMQFERSLNRISNKIRIVISIILFGLIAIFGIRIFNDAMKLKNNGTILIVPSISIIVRVLLISCCLTGIKKINRFSIRKIIEGI